MAVLDLSPFNTILQRLESVAHRLEGAAGTAPAGGGAAAPTAPASADAPLAVAFDAFLAANVPKMEQAAGGVGNAEITATTEDWVAMMKLLRALFAASDKCAKPKDEDWMEILKPLVEVKNRADKAPDNRSDFFSHRKAIAESMAVLMLPTQPNPSAVAQQAMESMDFHANKVLMKKIPEQTTWMKAVKDAMKELTEFCKENIKLGIDWKVGGGPAKDYFAANPVGAPAAAAAAPKGKGKGAAPALPKGGLAAPPPELFANMTNSTPQEGGGGMSAVMAQLSGDTAVTSGLKKVTDDMKTKNRSADDKAAAPIVPKAKPAAARASVVKGKGPRGDPIVELQRGSIWMVENQEGGMHTLSEDVEQSHLVCIINCKNTTIKLDKKVKNVCIDGCLKVSVLVGDVLSAVEFVNSDRCVVQTIGKVNSFAIDKCDGAMIHLSKDSLEAEITTAKSSEMNISMPDPNGEDGDIIEMPIPEQFVSKVNLQAKKLTTRVSDLYS